MNKKTKKEFEAWANELLQRLHTTLKLQAFDTPSLRYAPEDTNGDILQVPSQYPYRWILIKYGDKALQLWETEETDVLTRCFIHEMVHVVLDELATKANSRSTAKEIDETVEATTEHLTTIINGLMND